MISTAAAVSLQPVEGAGDGPFPRPVFAFAGGDGQLKVYGVHGLRIADASILPRVTTGNPG